jgi:hypothetical protein
MLLFELSSSLSKLGLLEEAIVLFDAGLIGYFSRINFSASQHSLSLNQLFVSGSRYPASYIND